MLRVRSMFTARVQCTRVVRTKPSSNISASKNTAVSNYTVLNLIRVINTIQYNTIFVIISCQNAAQHEGRNKIQFKQQYINLSWDCQSIQETCIQIYTQWNTHSNDDVSVIIVCNNWTLARCFFLVFLLYFTVYIFVCMFLFLLRQVGE